MNQFLKFQVRIMLLLCKPLFRTVITFSFWYFFFVLFALLQFSSTLETESCVCFASVGSNSRAGSADWESFDLNVIEDFLYSEPPRQEVSNLRIQNAAIEANLFSRIQQLEDQLVEGLPNQLNPGEYANLVRENLDSCINPDHYKSSLKREVFELEILELEMSLQDKLFHFMITEPNLDDILNRSPFGDKLRDEAVYFIKTKVEEWGFDSIRNTVDRRMFKSVLRHYAASLDHFGRNSSIYRDFYSYFLGQ